MSEQPTAPSGGGTKIMGMNRTTFYLVAAGTALVGGLAYFWWKNFRNAQQQAQAATQTASTTTGSGGGNVDYSGELSVIQTELESVLAGQNTGGTTTTTTTPPPPPPSPPSGQGVPTGPPVSVAVPNGSGGWMNYTFPSQEMLNTFYLNIGVRNGFYPNGLSTAQITSALAAVGAYPQTGPTATPGPGTGAPPPGSSPGQGSYGPY